MFTQIFDSLSDVHGSTIFHCSSPGFSRNPSETELGVWQIWYQQTQHNYLKVTRFHHKLHITFIYLPHFSVVASKHWNLYYYLETPMIRLFYTSITAQPIRMHHRFPVNLLAGKVDKGSWIENRINLMLYIPISKILNCLHSCHQKLNSLKRGSKWECF